ncbi:hypothetical protein D3C72_1624060 [compost metagenome]
MRVKRLAQREHLESPDVPDPQRQQVTRSRFGNQGEIDERRDQLRVLAEHHVITMQQHGGPDADGLAIDRGDNRYGRIGKGAQEAMHVTFAGAISRRDRREFAEIIAGRKAVPVPLQQQYPDSPVLLCLLDGVGKCAVHLVRQGVHLVRPRKRHGQHAAGEVNADFGGHWSVSR